MSKVVSGFWHAIPHAERVKRWERVYKVLDDMSEHAVDHHFEMATWGAKTECGTIGCAAGHCSFDPWFRRRGFGSAFVGSYADFVFTGMTPEDFFGMTGYCDIFLEGFGETKTGRPRSPRFVHAAVKRAVRKYIGQLRRRRVDE